MKSDFSPDAFDLKILAELQRDADQSMQELGDKVGLSHTPCWRRVRRLEEQGVIRGRVTLLNAEQLEGSRLRVTLQGQQTAGELLQILARLQLSVHDLETEHPGLEEVFLQLTQAPPQQGEPS